MWNASAPTAAAAPPGWPPLRSSSWKDSGRTSASAATRSADSMPSGRRRRSHASRPRVRHGGSSIEKATRLAVGVLCESLRTLLSISDFTTEGTENTETEGNYGEIVYLMQYIRNIQNIQEKPMETHLQDIKRAQEENDLLTD